MDSVKKVARISTLGIYNPRDETSQGKNKKKMNETLETERANAARAAQKSAGVSPSLMTPLSAQSKTNSLNGMGKVGKY